MWCRVGWCRVGLGCRGFNATIETDQITHPRQQVAGRPNTISVIVNLLPTIRCQPLTELRLWAETCPVKQVRAISRQLQ